MSSFGETLRRERELRQISLREISEATKINLRYLDALERDDFRHLPGGVFNKGFVRAYAQFIGIDPEAMVTAYLEEDGRQQARASRAGGGAVQDVQETAEPPRALGTRLWLAALVFVLLLVVLAAGLTALGYGPLASRFKALRSSAPPEPTAIAGSRA
jgi:cytoskeletal protein RodZ